MISVDGSTICAALVAWFAWDLIMGAEWRVARRERRRLRSTRAK